MKLRELYKLPASRVTAILEDVQELHSFVLASLLKKTTINSMTANDTLDFLKKSSKEKIFNGLETDYLQKNTSKITWDV